MIWDESTPTLSSTANLIHTFIQNAKVMMRERAQATNTEGAPFDEHSVYGSSATGFHVKSKIGWVKIFATEAAMIAYTPKAKGALYYTLDTDSLFIVLDTMGNYEKVASLDHSVLTGRDDDDHTQYYKSDGTRAFSSWIYVSSCNNVISEGTDDDNAMADSHATQSWYAAHNADGGVGIEHFADACVSYSSTNIETTTTGFIYKSSWPFSEKLEWHYWGDVSKPNFMPYVTCKEADQGDCIILSYDSDEGSYMWWYAQGVSDTWQTKRASRISATTVQP